MLCERFPVHEDFTEDFTWSEGANGTRLRRNSAALPERFLFPVVFCLQFCGESADDVQYDLLSRRCRLRGSGAVDGICRWLFPGKSDPCRSTESAAAFGGGGSRYQGPRASDGRCETRDRCRGYSTCGPCKTRAARTPGRAPSSA